jgi:hypothetical protein
VADVDGTFAIVFSGPAGVGMGFFVVKDGELTGAGVGGGKFKGRVTANRTAGTLHVVFDQFVPAGLGLVQGTAPQELPMTRPVEIDLPAEYGDGSPVPILVRPAVVTAMIKRVPDDHAHFAQGVKLVARS